MTNLPVDGKFKVTCEYGRKGNLWYGGVHKGIDIVADNKTLYSTCDGVVKSVGWDANGWGQYVRIEEKITKKIHIFAHLVKGSVKVKVGQKVSRSTVIGTMGTTGNSTGVHLHFQIEKSNSNRTVEDPTSWLKIPNKVGTYHSDDYQIDKKPEPDPKPVNPKEEEDDDDMTQERFNEMMEVYLKQLASQPADNWAKKDLAWAEKEGLIKGDENGNVMPRKFLTREEMAAILHRYDGQK